MMGNSNGNDQSVFPHSWVKTTLGECFTWSSGGTPLKSYSGYYGGDIPWVIIGDLNDAVVFDTQTKITQKGLENSSAKWVEEGSVLLAMYGSIGKLGIAGRKMTTNQAIAFTKPDLINEKYLFFYLLRERSNLNALGMGATQLNISQTVIKAYPFILAPLAEQHRIVAKIEELFTQLDASEAALQRAKANLERYRRSVLQAAVTGELVPQDPNDEPVEEMLKHTDPEWRSLIINSPYLPSLPLGWCWTDLKSLSSSADYGTSQKCNYLNNSAPVLRIPNIINGSLNLDDLKFAINPEKLSTSKSLQPNDFLIIRTNGSRDLIGRSALIRWPFVTPYYFASYLIRFRVSQCSEWIASIWDSSTIRSQIEEIAATSAGQYNVSISSLSKIQIPLPPIREQNRIIAEIQRQLSVQRKVLATLSVACNRVSHLRQSILKLAFEGRLVEQNPEDEPASVLLQRIQAERSARPPRAKRNTRTVQQNPGF